MGYCLSKTYLAHLYISATTQIVIPKYKQHSNFVINLISHDLYRKTLAQTDLASQRTILKDGIYQAKKLSLFLPKQYHNFVTNLFK